MVKNHPHVVSFKIHRIQKYIFKTPILKVMIGASSLIGELIFHELPVLAKNGGEAWQLSKNTLKEGAAVPKNELDMPEDDPWQAYQEGILNNLGGHFRAIFTTGEGAAAFKEKALEKAFSKVPGIRIESRLFPVGECFDSQEKESGTLRHQGALPPITPWSVTCQLSGVGMALYEIKNSGKWVSKEVYLKNAQGKKFDHQTDTTHDILRLFEKKIFNQICGQFPQWGTQEKAITDFTDLIAPRIDSHKIPFGNLAIICIDGNRYTEAEKTVIKQIPKQVSYAWGNFQVELFWHKARCLMREAIEKGIDRAITAIESPQMDKIFKYLPFRIMMLGGDDLLLACAAELAFDFLLGFESAFREGQKKASLSLSFSAGIAFVPAHFPFHGAYELAETLLASAKKKSRTTEPNRKVNYVDWHVLYTGHTDSLDDIRKRDFQFTYQVEKNGQKCFETLLLTPKPYPIHSDAKDETTLQTLWGSPVVQDRNLSEPGDGETESQRKLKQMRHSLRQGKRKAELDFPAFFPQWENRFPFKALWKEVVISDTGKWKGYITSLYDLIEMMDLRNSFYRLAEETAKRRPEAPLPRADAPINGGIENGSV